MRTSKLPSPAWKRSFRRRLRCWFDTTRRDLPWRRTRDPYAVWVSEIMLQQTQVATVVGYFERFLAAFPTIGALAAAPESQVLRLWEGLGYYRRARQLHRAAQLVVAEHGGEFPSDRQAVRNLPGIGRYTAGAILSIAFDRPEPILEANTVRVLSRLAVLSDDPRSCSGQETLWTWAAALVPDEQPGLFNQAIMELGALVCTPRNPRCGDCPVAALCPTRRLGLQDAIPRPKPKPKLESVREAALLVFRRRDVLVVQRAEGDRWAGLWDFPRYAVDDDHPPTRREKLTAQLRRTVGVEADVAECIATLKHGVTRFRITLDAYRAEYTGGRLCVRGFAGARWVSPTKLADFPLHVTARKLAQRLLDDRRGP